MDDRSCVDVKSTLIGSFNTCAVLIFTKQFFVLIISMCRVLGKTNNFTDTANRILVVTDSVSFITLNCSFEGDTFLFKLDILELYL